MATQLPIYEVTRHPILREIIDDWCPDPKSPTLLGSWRVAYCLDQLLSEINASAPHRSKASDGSIGDEAHQSTDSDHNPHCQGWVVTARDFTHDPNGGFDSYEYAEWQRKRCRGDILLNGKRETRVKYIISNRKIASPTDDWAWRDYNGSNPHDKHVHVSVDCTAEGGYMDSTATWGWEGSSGELPGPPAIGGDAPEFPYASGHYLGVESPSSYCHSGYYSSDRPNIVAWQQRMDDRGWSISADGYYGSQSQGVCRSFQSEKGLSVDGKVGPQTWEASWAEPVT